MRLLETPNHPLDLSLTKNSAKRNYFTVIKNLGNVLTDFVLMAKVR